MRYTVVLTAGFPRIARDLLAPHFDVIEHPTEHGRTEEDMITILAEADAAITLLSDPITRNVLEANRNLRLVANHAVGYNNIDIDAARELGVMITNTPGVLTESTADLTMALLLAVTRRVVESDGALRQKQRCEWDPLAFLGSSLQAKRLGIIGMGRIGTAVATRARAFGMDVIGVRRDHSRAQLAELLATSDIVSIHAPLTSDTHHIMDAAAMRSMKPGSYLINTARGPLVDEEALCDALENRRLRGAGLDVYEDEPQVSSRLFALPNVVLLPHIGSATEEARTAMARIAATNVLLFLSGQEPVTRVV